MSFESAVELAQVIGTACALLWLGLPITAVMSIRRRRHYGLTTKLWFPYMVLAGWALTLVLSVMTLFTGAWYGENGPPPQTADVVVHRAHIWGDCYPIAMLVLEMCTIGCCVILVRITRSRRANSRLMWWLALGTCLASSVSSLIALGLQADAASSVLALGAGALLIKALVIDGRTHTVLQEKFGYSIRLAHAHFRCLRWWH